ncbi:1,3-propanediol dehydrogenase [Desulfonispora thiosulfatigenes DSM 11270]|uniref:1,3-propanediol dehydrogenase n=1 Tax=Desulfonispora thiosulfatigenes DSM 11270 TaxID=656914 RepID=A0A1W1VHL8_DESTI|nr:iron-containing alcohol dehydrogenase [Desulfonispora thiosulfatigenes]SMB92454.1 1,3-propanediol dehydrogenase [Desulfonispora thiosulfatigenes DSM 11270]
MSTFCINKQVEFGAGALKRIGELIISYGGTKVLLIVDSFLAKEPLNTHKYIGGFIEESGLKYVTFSDYQGEPSTGHVKNALAVLKENNCDCIVAVGGGSGIDLAKAVAVFAKNESIAWEEIASRQCLERVPLIAISTTSGTGSEATKVMVITNSDTNIKMNPGHPNIIPDVAILDPELTVSLPPNFTAFTGMDALTHAMEAYVSTRASSFSDFYAYESMKIVSKALPLAFANGADIKAREQMAIASYYAGIAFSNASTNLAHAGGRPLGAHFHIPHGLGVALLLPFVIEFGLEVAEERYAKVAIALGADPNLSQQELAKEVVKIVDNYNEKFGIWEAGRKYIPDIKVLLEKTPLIVSDALSGNGILTNPKVPNEEDVTLVFKKLADKLS